MALAGALEILISAGMQQLITDMNSAKNTVNSAMTNISSAVNTAKSVLGTLGIAFSVNHFAGMIRNSIDAQAEMFNLSQKIGASVEDLTGLAFAAKQSDIEMGTLEKGLRNLIVEIGKANDGSKESAKKFRDMGVELRNSNGDANSLTDILGQMSGYFSGLPDGIGKTNTAIGILGARYGTEFIPLLNNTESAFNDLTAQGREFSGMTTESAAAAEKLGDEIDATKAQIQGYVNEVASFFVTTINGGIALIDWMRERYIDFYEIVGAAAGTAKNAISELTTETSRTQALAISPAMQNLVTHMRNAATEAGNLAADMPTVNDAFEEMRDYSEGFVGPSQGMQAISEEVIKQREGVYDVIGGLKEEIIQLGLSDRQRAIRQAQQKAGDAVTTQEMITIAALTGAIYDEGQAIKDAAEESRLQAIAVEESARKRIEAEKEAAEKAAENWQRTHEYLTTTFIDIFNNGKNAFDNIARAFKSMVERMVAEWLASGLMGLVSGHGFGGFTATGGGGGSIMGTIGSVASSIFGGGGAGVPGSASFVGPLQQGATAAAGSGGIFATIGSGITTAASTIWGGVTSAAGAIGSGAMTAGSAVMSALSAIPGWGWALAGLGLAANALDSGGTYSHNAGFLLGPVANMEGRTFDVDAFDSGFDPIGFNRRTSVEEASAVIDTFRTYDSVLTKLARDSGMTVNYSNAPFNGYDEKGRGNGLFYGSAEEDDGGKGTALDIQLNQFVADWIRALGYQIDPASRDSILAGGTADEMIARAAATMAIDGSHAAGLNYVPFDGYRAVLHQGERVQTDAQARAADRSSVELRAVREVLQATLAEMGEMKRYMRELFAINAQWNDDGLPAERV